MALLISSIVYSQQQQKYINYQGVARDASNELIVSQSINIEVALRFGTTSGAALYAETHTVTTDGSGVFSLLIGNGTVLNGVYNNLEWGVLAPYATISLNGTEVGTVELYAVPYSNASGKATDMEINDLTNVEGMPLNGQVLKYNGTSWEPSSGGASTWTQEGDNIYYNNGNVGINNSNPSANLDVVNEENGFANAVGVLSEISGGATTQIGFSTEVSNGIAFKYGYKSNIINNSSSPSYGFHSTTSGNGNQNYGIYTTGEDGNYFSGNIGLGVQFPSEKIDVDGNIKVTGEVNRPSTGSANMVPIAYGNVRADGTVAAGTGNFTVDKLGYAYDITVNGESINTENYIITSQAQLFYQETVLSVANDGILRILISDDASTTNIGGPFYFIIYKP